MTLFCKLHVAGLQFGYNTDPEQSSDRGRARTLVSHTGDAVAHASFQHEDGRWPVVQRGAHRMWDTIETAAALWDDLDQPHVRRLGVSALDHVDRQYVWLDDPNGPYCWPLRL